MKSIAPRKKRSHILIGAPVTVLFVVLMSACATNPSPDPSGPSAAEPTYPILLVDADGERRAAALAEWVSLTRDQKVADSPAPEFQPVTATLRSIPSATQYALVLPRVGESTPMSEEELREALRRFISDAGLLLCGDPQQLSLIQRVDGADGVKHAVYKQRPFRYALRGGYGELKISFTPDRRIVGVLSTCIPESERIRRGFVGLGQQRVPAEKVIEGLLGRVVTYIGMDGSQQTYTITGNDKVNARELVVYPIQRAGEPPAIEFHVAWEIAVETMQGLTVYVDSITGDILATKQGLQS